MTLIVTKKSNRKAGRRPFKRPEITPQQARKEAERLLRGYLLPPKADRVIEALSTGGVLTSGQLHRIADVSLRTLQRYAQRYWLDRIPVLTNELLELGIDNDPRNVWLYTLGPVGFEIARLRLEHTHIPTGYTGYGTHRIIHDVLVNEVVLRLSELASPRGYELLWVNKYGATVRDEHGRPALEPDALLAFRRDGEYRRFLVELHNEDNAVRAEKKVRRYEQVYRDGRWRDVWECEDMPAVLAVFTHRIVGKGYRRAVEKAKAMGLRCTFLGKAWEDVVSGNIGAWWNFNTGRIEKILDGR